VPIQALDRRPGVVVGVLALRLDLLHVGRQLGVDLSVCDESM
jgi:hypothetical protein